jgi:glycosyltransferase involved in cell wall biosynthesis
VKIISFGLTTGSGFWRVRIPFGALNEHGHECYASTNAINDEEMSQAKVIVLKNVIDQMGIASALAMREMKGTKIVMDVDDDLEVGEDHPLKKVYEMDDTNFTQRQTAKAADLITCTTEYLAEKLRKLNPNVKVIPNYYEPNWFNVKQRTHDGPLRIGWAGGGTHEKDLEMMTKVIKTLVDKYGVEIVVRGDTRIKKMWGNNVEYFPTVPIEYYPEALASMAIDIGICPLTENEFNRCKSPIKAMEYGLLGIPSVCSPTVYGNYPILTTAKTEEEWIIELSKLIEGEKLRKVRGSTVKRWVEETFNINDHWKEWEDALC